jgi:hypothetical protein
VRRSRRRLAAAAGVVAVCALAPLGIWERNHAAAREAARIATVRAAVGKDIQNPRITSYRMDARVSCILYRRGPDRYGLELCFDPRGRLVETYERRGTSVRVTSLLWRPQAAPARESPRRLARLFQRLELRMEAGRGILAGRSVP